VLAKPSNLPLDAFMAKYKATMYSAPHDALASRILPSHRPVAYQWALHLIDGIGFAHAHDVILADFDASQCWLSSDPHLTLSLAGFLHASFSYTVQWGRIIPASVPSNRSIFHPLVDGGDATKQTDLFMFGCVLFEIMTGFWPSKHFDSRSWDEREAIVRRKEWPPLEDEFMGKIVRECWNNQFDSTEQVTAALVLFVQDLGWEVDEKSNLKDFDAAALFS
jgi:serine/threonine protein kinase